MFLLLFIYCDMFYVIPILLKQQQNECIQNEDTEPKQFNPCKEELLESDQQPPCEHQKECSQNKENELRNRALVNHKAPCGQQTVESKQLPPQGTNGDPLGKGEVNPYLSKKNILVAGVHYSCTCDKRNGLQDECPVHNPNTVWARHVRLRDRPDDPCPLPDNAFLGD